MPTTAQISAVLLAGGKGERLGGTTPKQFLQLVDRPMFCHSLDVFEICPAIKSVVFVVPDRSFDWPRKLYPKLFAQVQGGSTRQGSVANALSSLPTEADLVMVHDAARPLIDTALLQRLIGGLDPSSDGVIPGLPLEDAIKKVSKEGWLESELERASVYRVQTPQLFRRGPLEAAIERALSSGEDSPDCSQMLTRAGYRVKVVEGDELNIKVTRPADLRLAETYLRSRSEGRL
jgi:2-C-methyl-D-erythritol 4-phosphate cytidylyltransferase